MITLLISKKLDELGAVLSGLIKAVREELWRKELTRPPRPQTLVMSQKLQVSVSCLKSEALQTRHTKRLTIDVEDYFPASTPSQKVIRQDQWDSHPLRVGIIPASIGHGQARHQGDFFIPGLGGGTPAETRPGNPSARQKWPATATVMNCS